MSTTAGRLLEREHELSPEEDRLTRAVRPAQRTTDTQAAFARRRGMG
jgi:hypothetical protein